MFSQSSKTSKTSDYKIRILTIEDKPAIYEFIKQFFYTNEPLNEATNRAGEGKLSRLTPADCPMNYLPEGLSVAAVTPSGEIIGVLLNSEKNLKGQDCNNPDSASDKSKIHKLLDHVEAKITSLCALKDINNKEMDVKAMAVHEEWRNKGIGRKLLEQTKDLAHQRGFNQLRTICTSAYTAKMFINCGFECVYSLKYEDCIKDGTLKFLPQPPHTHIKGMVFKF